MIDPDLLYAVSGMGTASLVACFTVLLIIGAMQ